MTLRAKLTLALTLAALVPMAVALALPMLRAGKRAEREAALRLEAARRQAGILVERERSDVAARVALAASEIARDRPERQALWQGPAAAGPVVLALAQRYGLDHLQIRDARGDLVAVSDADPRSDPAVDLLFLAEGEASLRPLPYPASASDRRVGYFVRRTVESGRGAVTVIGGRLVGRALIEAIGAITEQPAALVDGEGLLAEEAGGGTTDAALISGEVPLGGGGWRVRVFAPAGDTREIRRGLLAAFAGIAPLAAAGALLVGWLLAGGISRPIQALAARAEATAADAAGEPLAPLQDGDEVRRLRQSFDRMLGALAQSERQRGAAERMAAWQEVARRVAHEVKNPLSPIRVAVENLRRTRRMAPNDFERSFEEETATILEEVESLRRLVEEFSEFARLPPPRPAPCDLRQVLAQALALFAPRVQAAGIEVEVLDGGLSEPVTADAEQIGRALKNVLANALDALEGAGSARERRVSIALRPVVVSRAAAPERFAEIEVRDNGPGFAPEALRRVFEPYFTTRAGRGGTGLGMAIAYRIVTDHGGRIQADEAPGGGAVVTVRLPVAGPEAAGPDAGGAEAEAPPAAGSGAAERPAAGAGTPRG